MRLILADRNIAQQVLTTRAGASASALEVVAATSPEEITRLLASAENNVLLVSESASSLEALRQALADVPGHNPSVIWIGQDPSPLGWGLPKSAGREPDVSAFDEVASQLQEPESTPALMGETLPAGDWLCSLSGAVSEAILRIRDGRLTQLDGSFARKMGFSVAALPQTRVGNLFLPSDRYALHLWLKRLHHTGDGPSHKDSLRLTMRGEEGEFPVAVSHIPSTGSRNDSLLLLEPVGESHLVKESPDLLLPAQLDSLTGLPDHDWFLESVRQAITRARYLRQGCYVLVCRLEGMQAIARELGDDAANDACQTAAIRLRRAAGPGSSLSRIGPYEFACVFVSGDAQGVTEQQILHFQRAIRPPVTGGSAPMHLSLRFGASEYTSRMERPRALIRLARTRAAVAFLLEQPVAKVASQNLGSTRASSLEQEIDRACERNEFEIFLQPIVHLRSFAIRGAEVLIRWRHPERGLLSPAHFLPMAESTGQISRIGQWVLESVCAHAAQWGRQLQHRPRFSVNVSPVELHDHRFLANTLAILDKYPLHPVEIELEITETAVLASESKTAEVVECLRRQGVKTALDDFGVGYSSLSHLREIPFSKLKIDRTFVHGAPASHRCRTIVRSMVELARGLRIEVTAEGVENPDQLRFLYEAGCDEVQGYLFARPMPPNRFDSWVAGYQGKASAALGQSDRSSAESTGKVVPFHRNVSPV